MQDHMTKISSKLASRLDAIACDVFDGELGAGVAAALVVDREIAWFKGLGYSDLESRRVPDQFTTSRVASITKTFTATAIMQLRDAGLLELEDPLVLHVPEFAAARALAGTIEGVTIKRLLTHHSGLSTEPPLPTWAKPEFPDRERILDALPDAEVVISQDSQWKYSNFAFGLLGEVIYRLSGRPYIEYVESEILDPLGLAHTAFEVRQVESGRMATGYQPALEPGGGLVPAPYAHLRGLTPAGQLHSNVHDLARWIAFHTGALGSNVLDPCTLDEMHRPVYVKPDWSWGQALGWRAIRRGDRVYLNHGGGIHGYSSEILFNKPSRVGAITLANVWPPSTRNSAGAGLLDAALDELGAVRGEAKAASAAPQLPPGIEGYLGSYFAQPAMAVELTQTESRLALEPAGSNPYQLHAPCGLAVRRVGDGMEIRVVDGRGAGERLDFQFGIDGEATGFVLGGFLYEKTA